MNSRFLPEHITHTGDWMPTGLPVSQATAEQMVLNDLKDYKLGNRRFCLLVPVEAVPSVSFNVIEGNEP